MWQQNQPCTALPIRTVTLSALDLCQETYLDTHSLTDFSPIRSITQGQDVSYRDKSSKSEVSCTTIGKDEAGSAWNRGAEDDKGELQGGLRLSERWSSSGLDTPQTVAVGGGTAAVAIRIDRLKASERDWPRREKELLRLEQTVAALREEVNRLDEYVEQDRESVAWHVQSNGSAAGTEKIGRVPADQQNLVSEWRDSDPAAAARLLALDPQKQLDNYPVPMSPSLISFIASEASCLPHDLEEAKRAGLVYSSSHDDPTDFFRRNENGDNSQGALQALLSKISLESNPSPIIALDTARSLIRGQRLSTGTQSDTESIWRPEIASPSSSITFRLPRDIQPIYSVTESGNMILEGSNLNQAIEILSTYEHPGDDDELMMAVVLVHRLVSTPMIFLKKLISRFHVVVNIVRSRDESSTDKTWDDENDNNEVVVMRHKICSIILVWLRDFYRDLSDDSALVATLKMFLGLASHSPGEDHSIQFTEDVYISEEVDWSNLMLVKDVMQRVLEDRLALLAIHQEFLSEKVVGGLKHPRAASQASMFGGYPPAQQATMIKISGNFEHEHGSSSALPGKTLPTIHNRSWHLLQLKCIDVARQLTLLESRLFFRIRYDDLLQSDAFIDGSWRRGTDSFLQRMLDSSERISQWVSTTIVMEQEHQKRVLLIEYFVDVADECQQLRNFSTMMAVWDGLKSEPVRRLERASGEALVGRVLPVYAYIDQLVSEKNDFSHLCSVIDMVQQNEPCVPFLMGYLSEITRIHKQHKDMLLNAGSQVLNLRKARLLASAVKRIVRHQDCRYNFPVLEPVESYLSDLLIVDQETLIARSMKLEPPYRYV